MRERNKQTANEKRQVLMFHRLGKISSEGLFSNLTP